MNFGAPEIIYIILLGINVGLSASNHGKLKEGKHHFGFDMFVLLLGVGLLYWGGFFK